ncbi:MAG TPA: alpha/beta hydrolase family protein [Steroidobacteraceae bacterium]|nr:alpha/beta hydrolase family protein [Steroidobacteraceae bacterium]
MTVTSKRHSIVAIALLALSIVSPAFASVIVTREFDSKALSRKWSYNVYLPEGYDGSTLRYPVLYLLHGNSGNFNDWTVQGRIQPTADELMESGQIPQAIIVMPDAGSTWYVDRKEQMETAFLQDLMPDVEAQFRTIATRNGRVIGGLSMGGYGSLRFALKHPEKFAAAALLSPAIYDPEPPESSGARRVGVFGAAQYDGEIWKQYNWPTLWDTFIAKKQPVPMYINSGDDDDFMIESEATKLYSLLRKNKQPAELRIVNGAHTWAVWESTIGDAMKYVFRYASRPVMAEPSNESKKK